MALFAVFATTVASPKLSVEELISLFVPVHDRKSASLVAASGCGPRSSGQGRPSIP